MSVKVMEFHERRLRHVKLSFIGLSVRTSLSLIGEFVMKVT